MLGGRSRTTRTGDPGAAAGAPGDLRANYTGAVYGSLLAASVVVGAAVGGGGRLDVGPGGVAALLIVTGLVFCVAHAYARLVGDRIEQKELTWREIGRVA